ncbi:MAG: 50S ribosomal protein L13 [Methanobacterium sp.]
MIIDGEGLIMGRLASTVSKMLLNGESVVVLNAEKILISGTKEWAYARYKQRLDRASISNPRKMGPKYPRRPDDIFRRTVRGMIPYRKTSGREAFKGLKVFVGIPKEFADAEIFKLEEAMPKNIKKSIELGTISKLLGAKFEV